MADSRRPSSLERESLEMEYRIHQQDGQVGDGYNRVMFYVGLIAFALVGASVLL